MARAKVENSDLANLHDKNFNHFPDEVVLKILSYLDIDNLPKCSQVSQRMRNICKDKSLWERINLNGNFKKSNGTIQYTNNIKVYQNIPTSFINYILDNGCKYLNICHAELRDGIDASKTSELKYLAFARIGKSGWRTKEALEDLTSTTYCLERFSIALLTPQILFQNTEIVIRNVCLNNYMTLTVLNLQVSNLTFESAKNIVACSELKELGLAYPNDHQTSYDTLTYLVQNISPEIKKISFEGKRKFKNEHVKMLVTRCQKLEELCLRNTSITIIPLNVIVKYCSTLVKLDLSNNGFINHANYQKYLLRFLPKLIVVKLPPSETWNKYWKDMEWEKGFAEFDPDPMYIADPHEIGNEFEEDGLWEIKGQSMFLPKHFIRQIYLSDLQVLFMASNFS